MPPTPSFSSSTPRIHNRRPAHRRARRCYPADWGRRTFASSTAVRSSRSWRWSIGLGLGLGAAIGLARLVESLVADLLLGLTATDAANLLTALAIMVGSAVTACLLPAFRVTRIDPLQALRHE